ncbi:MAG: DUF1206 domain-containing protein [Trueperaceae bacterium]|nr:DUF1206 domain-containing protein [Trueperaceae bacterium]
MISDISQRQEPDWLKLVARIGYGAKGIVYLLIGILTAEGSRGSDSKDAFSTIAQQPFGTFLLALVAVGLLAYASWRFLQGITDPEREGSDASALAKRLAWVASGIVYVALAISAGQIIFGAASGGGAQDWTAKVLHWPFGRWLIGAVGLGIFGGGVHQLKEAISTGFKEDFALHKMNSTEKTWATRVGRIGYASRSVVYFLIAWFLVQSALTANPSEAGGLAKALNTLQSQPYGPWLLGLTSLGLMCYGLYCFVMARYRKAVA